MLLGSLPKEKLLFLPTEMAAASLEKWPLVDPIKESA
jgi:hypothetical protein